MRRILTEKESAPIRLFRVIRVQGFCFKAVPVFSFKSFYLLRCFYPFGKFF